MSKIQWTDATWNPTVGCTRVSPGCEHCYAEGVARRGMQEAHRGLTTDRGRWNGTVRLLPERLAEPLRWRKPRRVFVDSMSDLFHERVPFEFIDKVFGVMASTPHTYQVLTKRPGRMCEYLSEYAAGGRYVWKAAQGFELPGGRVKPPTRWPLPNVWLGVSVEDQPRAYGRIPLLLQTPAAVRFLSLEPLLRPVDLVRVCDVWNGNSVCRRWVDWVIVGGESGPGARPCRVEWIRDVVRQCREAGVPCFVKQLGSRPEITLPTPSRKWPDSETDYAIKLHDSKGGDPAEWPEDLRVREWPAT